MDVQKKLIVSVFQSSDEDKKGYLTKEDYKVAVIKLLGYKPSKYELVTAWKGVCQEEGLSLEQFVQLMYPRVSQKDSSEKIRKIFIAFDRFCHGFISLDDCLSAFNKVSIPLSSDSAH